MFRHHRDDDVLQGRFKGKEYEEKPRAVFMLANPDSVS